MIGPKDPDRQDKLAALRGLLDGLPADETAVFQDEVDVNLNPKVGSMWMKGQQADVETPGNNEKRYLAGTIHWRTGQVFVTEGKPKEGRGAALFLPHLDDLRRAPALPEDPRHLRQREVPHQRGGGGLPVGAPRRIDLHYLPKYGPDCNPIERVWWRLHDRSPGTTGARRCRSCWT